MLYSLAIEPLLHKLRGVMSGLHLPFCESKYFLSAYADDLVVFVKTQKDVDVLIDTVFEFERISSAKVNWNKSEALLCGKWENMALKLPQALNWSKKVASSNGFESSTRCIV